MPKRRHKAHERRIALERMETLFRLAAEEARRRNAARAKRYVDLARRIGMRYNVRVPRASKRTFCKACGAFLLPSVTARVRLGDGRIAVTCGACGAVQRLPYRREQAARRRKRTTP